VGEPAHLFRLLLRNGPGLRGIGHEKIRIQDSALGKLRGSLTEREVFVKLGITARPA
jgi:hypothetical protein